MFIQLVTLITNAVYNEFSFIANNFLSPNNFPEQLHANTLYCYRDTPGRTRSVEYGYSEEFPTLIWPSQKRVLELRHCLVERAHSFFFSNKTYFP